MFVAVVLLALGLDVGNDLEDGILLDSVELFLLVGLEVAVGGQVAFLVVELGVGILLGAGHGPGHLAVEQPVEESVDLGVLLHFDGLHVAFELLGRLVDVVLVPHDCPADQLVPLHLILLEYLRQFGYSFLLHQPLITDVLEGLVLAIEIREGQFFSEEIRLLEGGDGFLEEGVHEDELS